LRSKSIALSLLGVVIPLFLKANHAVEALGLVVELAAAAIVAVICIIPTVIHLVLKRVRKWTSIFWIIWDSIFGFALLFLHTELDEGIVFTIGLVLFVLVALVILKATLARRVKKV